MPEGTSHRILPYSGCLSSPHTPTPSANLDTPIAGARRGYPSGALGANATTEVFLSQIVTEFNSTLILRDWLARLYDALYPPWYILGCSLGFSTDILPEAIPVIRSWVQTQLYAPRSGDNYFTLVMITTTLAFTTDNRNAMTYLNRIPCITNLIIRDFAQSLRTVDFQSISQGIEFLR